MGINLKTKDFNDLKDIVLEKTNIKKNELIDLDHKINCLKNNNSYKFTFDKILFIFLTIIIMSITSCFIYFLNVEYIQSFYFLQVYLAVCSVVLIFLVFLVYIK